MLDQTQQEHTTLIPTQELSRDYAYYKNVFDGYIMPFAYLDLDLLAQNIHDIVARAENKKVRLASKSLRSVAVIQRILAASSTFQGVMSFTAPRSRLSRVAKYRRYLDWLSHVARRRYRRHCTCHRRRSQYHLDD